MNLFLKKNIYPYIVFIVYRLYMATVRYIEPELPESIKKLEDLKQPYIFAHFHQDELILIERRRNSGYCTMTSTSTDGEMMTRFLKLMGYNCVRGSSTRNGAHALLAMIKFCLQNRLNPVMAVDGPRGPIYKVKKGTVVLAQKTGFPIVPVAALPVNAFCFTGSWNKALLPKPFSRVKIAFGEPVFVEQDASEDKLGTHRHALEQELNRIKFGTTA